MKTSIKYKILSSFAILIFFSLGILIYFTNSMINRNNEYVIKKEIIDIKKHSDMYIKQLYLNKGAHDIKEFIHKYNNEILEELSYKIGNRVTLYSSDGEVLVDSLENNSFSDNSEDLIKAKNNEKAYTINYKNNQVIVKFSYPIEIDNERYGIVRYTIDYSDIYNEGNKFIDILMIFSAILFIVTVIISLVIAKGITQPIKVLTGMTKSIADGNLDVDDEIKSSDEIGELFNNFKTMAKKLKDQINRIERDNEAIKKLEKHRKRFLDNVTHELKTPLTTILGYAEMIEDNGFSNDEEFFEKGINHIIKESKRLRTMVVDLIDFSQIENRNIEDEFKEVNLSYIVLNTCEEMKIKAMRYNIDIINSIEPKVLMIGHGDKLKQVFINIIDNSIKYSSENSIIKVELKKLSDRVRIVILDEGQGIAESKINNIFEPFYRDKSIKGRENASSSGLGLAISKAIVEKHRGHIYINSEVDKGTKVVIELGTIK